MSRFGIKPCLSLLLVACVMVSGCAVKHRALVLDRESGKYPTTAEVSPSEVTVYDTSIDPKSYRAVVLIADATLRPSVFAVTVRQALAEAGITRVYTPLEFVALAANYGVFTGGGPLTAEVLRNAALRMGPVLVLSYRVQSVGNTRFETNVVASDVLNGTDRLRIYRSRGTWSDVNSEQIYPVLNQIRQWALESARGKV